MKKLLLISLVSVSILKLLAAGINQFDKRNPLTTNDVNQIVQAIYRTEGGDKTTHPYGIIIGKRKFTKEEAKRICENTVRNNYTRWQRSNSTEGFINYLANVYCPVSADPKGNANWKKNMKKFLS